MTILRSQLSLAKNFTRHLTKSKKVPVQLLQDFLPHGVKGQIIDVSPAFMRNVLHVGNKACYITKEHGPRIPVVKGQKIIQQSSSKKEPKIPEKPKDDTPALSLDELSSLFSNMKSSAKSKVQSFKATPDQMEPLVVEIKESVPQALTFSLKSSKAPITKATVADLIYKTSGVEIPKENIMLEDLNGKVVGDVSEVGEYKWIYTSSGGESIRRQITFY